MARIASAQIGTDVGIAAAPETRQVAGDLHRFMARRQQFDHQRNATRRDCWVLRQAEQLLHPDRHRRPLLGFIVDRHRRAGRRGEMRRRFGL
jgi:hypothetical protein